jgi:hypothetical protein
MQSSISRYTRIEDDDAVTFRGRTCDLLRYDNNSELLPARATAHLVWFNPRVTQRSGIHGEEVKSWN